MRTDGKPTCINMGKKELENVNLTKEMNSDGLSVSFINTV